MDPDYQPLILGDDAAEVIKTKTYRQFILNSTVVPGCRLLLKRSQLYPDWPYVNTKFNPGTGQNLPPDAYKVIYPWFLGRGCEALEEHRRWLTEPTGWGADEQKAVNELFGRAGEMSQRVFLAISEP